MATVEVRERTVDDRGLAGEHLAKVAILDEQRVDVVLRLFSPPKASPRGLRFVADLGGSVDAEGM